MSVAYFLSDLHLGAPYFADEHEAERRVVSFLDHAGMDADVIYLLGDILDYWYEYRYVVPRGFVRFFGKLAELSDRGIRIVWFIGNHDIWIFDYLPKELGIEVVDGTLNEFMDEKWFHLTHGDGVGRLSPSFRFIRKMFRNKTCQKLFAAIHPRWTVPFAYNWSSHSRKTGGSSGYDPSVMVDHLRDYSMSYLKEHPEINYFIYGHIHLLVEEALTPSARMIVLGEWLHTCSYARWDGKEISVRKWSEE